MTVDSAPPELIPLPTLDLPVEPVLIPRVLPRDFDPGDSEFLIELPLDQGGRDGDVGLLAEVAPEPLAQLLQGVRMPPLSLIV